MSFAAGDIIHRHFDLYGLQSADLESARQSVEAALKVKLVAHESGYHGGAYYRLETPGTDEHFILQRNYDEFEKEWAEPEFEKYSFLLYVNDTDHAGEIESSLSTAARLLRRQSL